MAIVSNAKIASVAVDMVVAAAHAASKVADAANVMNVDKAEIAAFIRGHVVMAVARARATFAAVEGAQVVAKWAKATVEVVDSYMMIVTYEAIMAMEVVQTMDTMPVGRRWTQWRWQR